jgi:hypothetical protein
MAGNSKSYLEHAEEAEANAAKATDQHVQRQFLEIAEQWRRLANPSSGRWNRPKSDDAQ